MHTPQLSDNLRRALLQAAIEGKLTERQADDGHAQDLLKQIQAEKAARIQAGRLKKSKGLPEISDDEIPFEIPENWVWVRIGDVLELINGRAYKQNELLETGKYKVLRVGNFFSNGSWYFSDLELPSDKYCDKGDLLYAWSASFGPKIWGGEKVIFHYHIWNVKYGVLNREFVYYFLMADTFNIHSDLNGTTMKHLSMANMVQRLMPLPPLAEQARIVAKLDALLAETDALKAQETALADAQKNFPKMLRASLLQAAIEGKLTERESEDGHAQELLEQIQAEKAAQIQAGRLKKSKGLPEIGEDEKPFAIPKNWVWVRLGDLAQILNGDRGKNYPGKNFWIDKGKPFINAGSLNNSVLDNNGFNYISEERYSLLRAGFIQKNDFLYCLRGSLGKFSLNRDFNEGVIGSSLCIIRTINAGLIPFIFYYLQTDLASEGIKQVSNGTAQPNLSAENVRSFLFPLPPLAEQARIVAKLDVLLAQIEPLENLS